jgi:hypothetical protein
MVCVARLGFSLAAPVWALVHAANALGVALSHLRHRAVYRVGMTAGVDARLPAVRTACHGNLVARAAFVVRSSLGAAGDFVQERVVVHLGA